MTEDAEEESHGLLAEQWLRRSGFLVQIDRGFEEGTYGIHVQYDALAERVGFAAAHRKAREYLALLKEKLGQAEGYKAGKTEDSSRYSGRGRKRDLDATFLAFPLTALDGQYHDEAMRAQFRMALLRAGQAWEQQEAREQTERRYQWQDEFRDRLAKLLEGSAYAGLDAATRERLLDEVPGLAFRARGREL